MNEPMYSEEKSKRGIIIGVIAVIVVLLLVLGYSLYQSTQTVTKATKSIETTTSTSDFEANASTSVENDRAGLESQINAIDLKILDQE